MAEKHNGSSTNGGERDHSTKQTCTAGAFIKGCIPFVVGIAVALVIGWGVYPNVLFAEKNQPIAFNHQLHLVKNDMACADCHTLRDDGSFQGLPTTEICATCHATLESASPAAKDFQENYVKQGKDVPWVSYQHQPANVYFNHAAHSVESCNTCHDFAPKELCSLCHIDVAGTTTPPPAFENRLTGYSKTTMTMDQCERCHAYPDHLNDAKINNACFVCHK